VEHGVCAASLLSGHKFAHPKDKALTPSAQRRRERGEEKTSSPERRRKFPQRCAARVRRGARCGTLRCRPVLNFSNAAATRDTSGACGCRRVELRALCDKVPRTPPGPEGSNGTGNALGAADHPKFLSPPAGETRKVRRSLATIPWEHCPREPPSMERSRWKPSRCGPAAERQCVAAERMVDRRETVGIGGCEGSMNSQPL
jgi:hypothetical protein